MRDLIDAGAVLALGSDWPVADADPRLGMAARAAAAAADARGTGPDQALTAHEALAGYTLDAAYAAGRRAWPGASASGCAPTSRA